VHRVIINAPDAPAPAGPYSHSVRVSGELLFISGQIPIDPATGELWGTTPAEQATRCLQNLQTIASAAGTSLKSAVKLTVYLTDIAASAEVNEVYSEFFPHEPPARVSIAVVGLPRGALVEIDAVIAVED
jgi:2-iminobutanoate/2-iminopropanoate deaminase